MGSNGKNKKGPSHRLSRKEKEELRLAKKHKRPVQVPHRDGLGRPSDRYVPGLSRGHKNHGPK